ncbi:MAG: hypothetical protein AB4041_08485 [Microcystaceae cyanobacterium]
MEVSRPNSKPSSPEELKDLETLRSLIEKAIADGLLSKDEMESIKTAIDADGKVTPQELNLCQELIWSKIDSGELEYDWS